MLVYTCPRWLVGHSKKQRRFVEEAEPPRCSLVGVFDAEEDLVFVEELAVRRRKQIEIEADESVLKAFLDRESFADVEEEGHYSD
jgi:IS4 transposase